jgi:hypothetical protein
MVVLLVISVVFVFAGFGMVVSGAEGGWPGLLFFGACAAVFAAQLWPSLLVPQKPEPVDVLLQRFPGPVELHIPQRKTALILAGVIVFAGCCAYYLYNEQLNVLVAGLLWFCVIVLALSVPFVLFQLIRGASLRLEGDGFRIKAPWKWRFVRWKDAGEFAIGSTSLVEQVEGDWSTVVTYDDANVDESKKNVLLRSITGRNSHLPDTYGMSAVELQSLMNGWRALALRQA